jgi:membrane-bound lytic murein transglycosylase D
MGGLLPAQMPGSARSAPRGHEAGGRPSEVRRAWTAICLGLLLLVSPAHAESRPVSPFSGHGLRSGAVDSDDLWSRIRQRFAVPSVDGVLVLQHEKWLAARPRRVQAMLERGLPHLAHIVEAAERRGMPGELVLLPIIESGLDPDAVSPAKAVGLWQFMADTGREMALQTDAEVDERRNVAASTRAALEYLDKLHRRFNDWHLALAAYNWGEGNVQRALDAARARGGGEPRYADLALPEETRNYIPRLQALKNLVTQPAAFGIALPGRRSEEIVLAAPSSSRRLPPGRAMAVPRWRTPVRDVLHMRPHAPHTRRLMPVSTAPNE